MAAVSVCAAVLTPTWVSLLTMGLLPEAGEELPSLTLLLPQAQAWRCCRAPNGTKPDGTTSPSLQGHQRREKSTGSSISAWSGAMGVNFAQQGYDIGEGGEECQITKQDLDELYLNNAVEENIIVIAHS